MKRSDILTTAVAILMAVCIPRHSPGQIIYGTYNNQQTGQTYVIMIDLATCTRCDVLVLPLTPNSDLSVLPDGRIVLVSNGPSSQLLLYTPPSPTPTTVSVDPPFHLNGSLWYNGLLYVSGLNGLYVFDPVTNQVTHLGNWPAGMQHSYELYEINGQLYAMGTGQGPVPIWLVNINFPSNSTFVQNVQGIGNPVNSLTSSGPFIFFSTQSSIYSYNQTNNTSFALCSLVSLGITGNNLHGMSYLPDGVSHPTSCDPCTTYAGTLTPGTSNFCVNEAAQVPHSGNEVLENDDLLQFILFTDPADTLGSILAVGNTPQFSFVSPPMQTGVVYHVAAIAGNDLNGNVDLADTCLSVSNAAQIIWRPLPSVSFSAANTDICPGQCATVTAEFTGSPPFILTYTTPFSGPVSQTFSTSPAMFQVCAPAGAQAGPVSVQATELSDAWCTCGN